MFKSKILKNIIYSFQILVFERLKVLINTINLNNIRYKFFKKINIPAFYPKFAGLLVFLFFIALDVSFGQAVGDYRSSGDGNWNTLATWLRWNGAWVAPTAGQGWPGQNSIPGTVTILNTHDITLNVTPANAIGNLIIGSGASGTLQSDNNNRTLNINGNLQVLAGAGFNLRRITLTVNGTANISGAITDNDNNGSNTFIGLFTVNNTGSFTTGNNSPFVFGGGIINNGAFTKGGTGNVTFNTNSQALSGSNTITISGGDLIINNNIQIDLTTGLSFSGTNFTNNSNAAIAFNASSGTFTFLPNAAQNINGAGTGTINFYDLILSGGNTKTSALAFNVNNNLTIGNGVTFNMGTVAATYNVGGSATIDGTLNFGTVNAKTFSISGDLINVTGTISKTGLAHILNLGGTNNAISTFTTTAGSGSTVNYNGTGAQQVFGSANYQNLTISNGGIKTIQGAIIIAGILNLSSGILQLGNNNLTITNNANNAIQGAFGSINMIETDGTGYLIKNAASLQTVYPFGTGNFYSPFILSSIAPNTGTVSVRAIASAPIGPNFLAKSWDVLTSITGKTITATFQFDPAEASGDPALYETWYKPGVANWQIPVGTSSASSNSFTITGTTSITNTSSLWTAGVVGTYYSYQTGNWNNPATWTSDPGGTTQVGSTVPGNNDVVVILDGRTVTLPADIASSSLDITINSGGFLDLSTYQFTAGLAALRGQGTLKLASANFPVATINTFVNTGGGTTEYNNPANFNLPAGQSTYNHLTINANGVIATQLSNITLNGDLYIKQGTYRINDNASTTARTLTINGNVSVDNGASITVGCGSTNTTTNPYGINGGTAPFINYYTQFHTVIINGNFTNNGTVRFTNLNYPVFDLLPPLGSGATSGAATVYFRGATNNTLTCNNTTDFYNLVLDKGVDQTFQLNVYSIAYSNFRLFGANISGGDNPGNNPNLKKALWIRTGTLVLKGLTIIPSLSEGTCGDGATPNSDFYIPVNGALILDGADVVVLSTADDYREVNVAYGVSGGTGLVNGVGLSGCSSYSILGKLQINNGYFSTRESGGFITWDWASGQFELNGGQVDAKQFRAAGGTGGLASFTQTGGILFLRGRFQRTPTQYTSVNDLKDFSSTTLNTARIAAALDGSLGTFNLNSAANVFYMSGGTIKIYDVCGFGGGQNGAFEVFSSTANINVTDGTLEIIPTTGSGGDAVNYIIESNASLGNLFINQVSGTSSVLLNTYFLRVLKNLTLQAGVLNANNLDVTIGGNFSIASGTTYISGTNSTIFNGTGNQTLTINLAAPQTLNKLRIDKVASDVLTLTGSQNILNISDSLKLITGQLNDNGKTINCSGNIYNSGVHYGTGRIVLNGTATQTISGNGSSIFGNLELNNTNAAAAPIYLTTNTTINGALTFSQDKFFNISTYNLILNSSASIVNSGPNRYIQTSGNAGDGSLTRVYSSSATLDFPVGVVNYTPASIGLNSAPSVYGSATVIPVNYAHPSVTTTGRSLTYFWRVKSSGFTLGPATVTHGYSYNQSNVITGAGITEDEYVAARYNPSTYTWAKGNANDVDETGNIIGEPGTGNFLENVSFIDGDYTAGDDNPTDPFGTPTIYYSRQTGLWSDVNNWSLTSHTVNNPPATPPGASDIVIIGGNDSIYLATNNTVANTGIQNSASLQIETGSALDIGYNPGCNFGMVMDHPNGNGNFRLTTSWNTESTFIFPTGDFSDFNVNLGTTELYSTNPAAGTTYWLPNGVTSYGNLILSPLGGSNIIFPNNDLLIYGNLITRGQNADSWFCPAWNINYPTAPAVRIPKTITVMGDMDIQGGSLVWYGNGAITQNVVVYGDVIVSPNSAIVVWGGATSQNLSIGKSLINNTTGATGGGLTTPRQCNFTLLPVTFFGDSLASITNTINNPVTIFESLTVNKGTSQLTTLTIDIDGTLTTPTDNWLTLQNGTLIYNRTGNFTVTTTSTFTIPGTSGLTINTPSNVYIANANSNTNDLYLNGKLTLISGTIFIGPAAAPNNNNDIEYSGGGLSEIDIQGGNLIVNGQIRRNPATSAGVLKFHQGGGQVVINGNGFIASNAKLEILNAGSEFNMSGGTLNIVRGGGGNTFGDLYLRPESSTISGGEIIFSQLSPFWTYDFVQGYILDATVPLNNLTVTGKNFGTSRNATVTLLISPLILNRTLKLSNANSIFDANTAYNISVTINGDFDNSGTYNHYQNLTTFNGGVQNILGTSVSDFYDLTVNPVTSLTLNGNTTINNDLTLSSGTLICGANTVFIAGDLTNNATYTDLSTGLELNGSSLQYISGSGTFGQLTLNNTSGARLNNSITLQKDLILTQGIFDINKYMITLGENSNIGGAPFSSAKMIASDGVFSNVGIKKFFGIIGAPTTFTYPIGTSSKYTPVILTINANTNVGFIRINNINSRHSAVIDPANVLNYFWEMESSGIIGFTGDVVFNYLQGDVMGAQENNYIAARLIIPGTSWSKTSTVNDVANTITFNFTGSNNLSGEYTAGIDPAFPDDVPQYTTNSDGIWTNNLIWDQTGGTAYPCPVGGPNGFIVIIDHEVAGDASYCLAYRTTINDKLRLISPYFGHNLGTVTGNGTLYLESGLIPAGRYTTFFDCVNDATLEYGGTGTYTLIADLYTSIPNLLFSGTGSRILPNKDLTICNSLVIGTLTDGPTLNNSVNNRKLIIQGTMERYNTGVFTSGSGSGATVTFAGSSAQTIGGSLGNFSGSNAFNNFEIDNTNGLTINAGGAVDVNGNLLLTDGLIFTSSANTLSILNTSVNCVTPSGGSSVSYINGPLIKKINQSDNFLFPVGKGSELGNKLTLMSTQTGPTLWTAEYFNPNTYSNFQAPLTYVNTKEYWNVTTPSGNQAIVNLKWDPLSDLTPLMTQNGLTDMRVTEHNGSDWIEVTSTATGDNYNGSVQSTNRISFPVAGNNVTLACINTTKPKATLSPTGPVCEGTGILLSFSQSPALNYTLSYDIDGIAQTPVNITTLPYSLPTPSAGVYKLTGFTYNNGASNGVVDVGTVTVYANPTSANAGTNQSLCGLTSATLDGNTPVIGTGLWSIINGTGGTVETPTSPTSDFNGTNGTTYTLRWTISNGSCTSSDDVVIDFPILPDANAGLDQNMCDNNPGVTLAGVVTGATGGTWSGGTGSYNPNANTLNAVYTPSAAEITAGTVTLALTTTGNGTCSAATDDITITIISSPIVDDIVDPIVCDSYTLPLITGTNLSGNEAYYTASGGAGTQYNETDIINSSTTLYIYDETGTTPNCISEESFLITVNALPTPTLTDDDADDVICDGDQVIFTAGGGASYNFRVNYVTLQSGASNTYTTTSLADGDEVKVNVTNGNGCIDSTTATTFTVIDLPTITLEAIADICEGTTNVDLPYSATTGTPDQYSIDFNATAEGEGFVDIINALLPATPISITVPVAASGETTYNADLTVTNSTTGCVSGTYAITITIYGLPSTGGIYHLPNN